MTPQELVLNEIQAQNPDAKLVAKQTSSGLVIMRCPTGPEIDGWQTSKESRRKSEDGLVAACTLYPDNDTLSKYLVDRPLLGSVLVIPVKALAIGMSDSNKEDVQGFPADLTDNHAMAIGKLAQGKQVWQVETEFGRVTLRLPHGIELDLWENSKATPRKAAEVLVLNCILDPVPEAVTKWFADRPLMPQWLANKLRGWCVGEVNDLQDF